MKLNFANRIRSEILFSLMFSLFLIICCSSLCLGESAPEEEWNITFGGLEADAAYSIQQTSDDGYILAGSTESFGLGKTDVWLLKIDSKGNEQWNRTYGGKEDDWAISVQQTSDEGYIVAGATQSFGEKNVDLWIIKTDSNGNKLWDELLGEGYFDYDLPFSTLIKQTSNDDFIITGIGPSPNINIDNGAWIIKANSEGSMQWSKKLSSDFTATSVQQTNDNGYISTLSFEDSDISLTKSDSEGNKQWTQVYTKSGFEMAFSTQQTSDEGYIIGGIANYNDIGSDIWIIKTDSEGNKIWDQIFGVEGNFNTLCSIQQTADGGYIISGLTGGSTFAMSSEVGEYWLIKINSKGQKEWEEKYGGAITVYGTQYTVQAKQTSDGGYILSGLSYSDDENNDVWVVKLAGNEVINGNNIEKPDEVTVPGFSAVFSIMMLISVFLWRKHI